MKERVRVVPRFSRRQVFEHCLVFKSSTFWFLKLFLGSHGFEVGLGITVGFGIWFWNLLTPHPCFSRPFLVWYSFCFGTRVVFVLFFLQDCQALGFPCSETQNSYSVTVVALFECSFKGIAQTRQCSCTL
jgi:hypothetical protein